jgi:cytochrome c heme-lyase
MGAQTSTSASNQDLNKSVKPPTDVQHAAGKGTIEQCPHFQSDSATKPAYPSECPMSAEKKDDINPLNMMPPANQMPAPDQPFPLSTTRVTSNIPKVAEKDENWVRHVHIDNRTHRRVPLVHCNI